MRIDYKRIPEEIFKDEISFSTDSEKNTFMVILHYFDGNREAQISNKELLKKSDYSMNTISESIRRLIKKGLIDKSRIKQSNQFERSLYWLGEVAFIDYPSLRKYIPF